VVTGKQILIIDDDRDLAALIRRVLSVHHTVRLAHSVTEGRAAVLAAAPDLILLDKNLPDGEGVDLVPWLKLTAPQAAVVILTADSDFSHVLRAIENGADDFLVKSDHLYADLMVRIPIALANAQRLHARDRGISRVRAPDDLSPELYRDILAASEAEFLSRALSVCEGDVSETARRLGISRSTLFNRISDLGLSRGRHGTHGEGVGHVSRN
jgi:two-component system response regulator RegA